MNDPTTKRCKRCGYPHGDHAPTCSHAKRAPLEKRFWTKVQKTDMCWIWTGAQSSGYGKISVSYRVSEYAHRVSWALHYGPIPGDLFVCHTCDNPSCVRPDHLFLGTVKDNAVDMVSKQRAVFQQHPEKSPKGEAHGMVKLTDDQVREMLARRFGTDVSNIRLIVRRKTWRHI